MEACDEEGNIKRPHVTTGNTPHKPDGKRRRSSGSVAILGKSAKKLTFPRSPAKIVKKSPLTRGKPLFSPLKELKAPKRKRESWSVKEYSVLVQFIALYKDMQPTDVEWPAMKAHHHYWTEAAQYIKDTANTKSLREASVVRQHVANYSVYMKQKFKKVEDAERFYGLDIEFYLSDAPTSGLQSQEPSLRLDPMLASTIKSLTQQQLQEAISIAVACVCDQKTLFLKMLEEVKLSSLMLMEMIDVLFQPLVYHKKMKVLDEQFVKTAITDGIDTNPADFVSISLGAMKVLQAAEKPNLIYKKKLMV